MISILITAAHEAETIGKALDAILKNKLRESYEILVIAPDAATRDAASMYAQKRKIIRVFQDHGTGKPAALNLLFAKARGRILILTDGDVVVAPDALHSLLRALHDPHVGAVSGRPIAINARSTMLGYWARLLTDVGGHETREKLVRKKRFIVCSGYLMAIRKGIVRKIPENALADDAVITNMISSKEHTIAYAPEAEVYVTYPTTFRDWVRQKRRSAGGYVQLRQLLKKKDKMRSFFTESLGFFRIFHYPKTTREVYWTVLLVFARLYLWLLIFYDMKVRQKGLKELWLRVESTKHGVE